MKRLIIRAATALLLGVALFAGLALAGVQAPPAALSPGVPQAALLPLAQAPVDPDSLKRDGDTVGLGEIVRYRVLAASDSPFDQAVKLRVRDSVLDYLRPELQKAGSESAAAAVIAGRLPEIRQVARQAVRAAGSNQPVQASWEVTAFPAKTYGPVVYPVGNYQALKIAIGAGAGKNWWCVLFPPLCYVDLTQTGQDLSGDQQIAPKANLVVAGDEKLSRYPRLTTKTGAWFTGSRPHSPISLFWPNGK